MKLGTVIVMDAADGYKTLCDNNTWTSTSQLSANTIVSRTSTIKDIKVSKSLGEKADPHQEQSVQSSSQPRVDQVHHGTRTLEKFFTFCPDNSFAIVHYVSTK